MPTRAPRRRTGDPDLDRQLLDVLDHRGSPENRDLLFEMLATVLRLASDDVDRLNLKITNAALKEMRQAFRVFAPYRDVPKVTIFGSARTLPDDPLYQQTRDLAAALARAGWMVVTGAGPGIMAAGAEGAGPERSIGVNIRLPFEEPNPFVAADRNLVSMKYFFTRKLMLMKESAGFAVLPGGFGTLDETFELLTLLQTGKASPAPIVLLEVPGGTYWKAFERFIREALVDRGMVSPDDLLLYRITDDVDDAVAEILGFFQNYHSIRYVGPILVMRLRDKPTREEIEALNRDFADICVDGRIEATDPLPVEVADGDHLDLARIAFHFDRMRHGRLRALVDAVNRLPSAPPLALPDPASTSAAGTPPDAVAEDEPQFDASLDATVAALVARAAGSDEDDAAAATAALQGVMAAGSLSPPEQEALVGELLALVTAARTPDVRQRLLATLAASSPFVDGELLQQALAEPPGAG